MGIIGSRVLSACAVALTVGGLAAAPGAARVLGTNRIEQRTLISNADGVTHCQYGELVPRGTRAVQLSLRANGARGPAVAVVALVGERAIAGGARAAGWSGESVTVPLLPAPRRAVRATLCMTAAPEAEIAVLGWNEMKPPAPGIPAGPRARAAYLDRMPSDGRGATSWPLALALALLHLLAG